MRTKKYARDLKVGDLLYHWDGEGKAEAITRISQAVTYTMKVHRNDIRNIESNMLDQRN